MKLLNPNFILNFLAAPVCGPTGDSEIASLINLEQELLKSFVDANLPSARHLHADDFHLITPDGYEYDKEQFMAQLEWGVLDNKIWVMEEPTTRLYGSMAVMRYEDVDLLIHVVWQT